MHQPKIKEFVLYLQSIFISQIFVGGLIADKVLHQEFDFVVSGGVVVFSLQGVEVLFGVEDGIFIRNV
jgi:hypothetical protein